MANYSEHRRKSRNQTGRADFYRRNDFNRICDRTGFKVKASNTRKEWNGLIVRAESWEPRHPQDFVRGRRDQQSVREARPDMSSFSSAVEQLSGLSGASASTTSLVPAGSIVVGVEIEVDTAVEGATSFDVGDGSDVDRWGKEIAIAAGTTTTPSDYTDPTSFLASSGQDVTLTANGSNFTAGAVTVTAYYTTPVSTGDL